MTPSATETNDSSISNEHSIRVSIPDRIAQVAESAGDRSEFLRRLASELSDTFEVELVAVAAPQWSSPMMLVSDPAVANKIDQRAITSLLKSSAPMPIACDVPLRDSQKNGSVNKRGLRVQIMEAPDHTAVLLIYDSDEHPSAARQVEDLKRLNEYADSTRSALEKLPSDSTIRTEKEFSAPKTSAQLSGADDRIAAAIRHRQSLQLFHRDLDIDSTAYRIANETRRLLECDRVTVLTRRGKKFKVRAVSGVCIVDQRSNSVKAVEQLASLSAVLSRPLIMPGEEPLPPQLQTPLDDYLDQSGVITTISLPIHHPTDRKDDAELDNLQNLDADADGEILAIVFLEYFSGQPPTQINPAMQVISSEATLALRNSLEHHQIFGLPFWKLLGKLFGGRRWVFATLAFLILAAALIASIVIEIDHQVIATGKLVPAEQRQVFAQVDGNVKELYVTDGDVVKAGDPLFLLENANLESRGESLSGEIQTATKRLSSIGALRLSPDLEPAQANRLAIEERQLKSELKNLNAQLELVRRQQDQLTVRSPIDGTIAGWQLERQLADRPVSRGNLLASVVDHNGPWSLRLQVPDDDAGPVLQTFQTDHFLDVRFAVATLPESTFAATLDSISTAARQNAQGENVLDATAAVMASDVPDLSTFRSDDARVGADVTAKITCGKRSVLKSWFGDVFDFVNRNIVFYFR